MFDELLRQYFIASGLGWAAAGAMFAVMFACIGSARGIRVAASQGTGILTEKPELYPWVLTYSVLPGTQGLYGFVAAILIATNGGLNAGKFTVSPLVGVALLFVGLCMGLVEWKSAVYQGETCSSCLNLVSKEPDQAGRSLALPVLVEFYGLVALLVAFLLINWLTAGELELVNPMMGG
ncbi:MAG: permease [Candidatus Brocadiia bacterium]